jgi:hypothetical protein
MRTYFFSFLFLFVSLSATAQVPYYTIYSSDAKPPEYFRAFFGLSAPTPDLLIEGIIGKGCVGTSTGHTIRVTSAKWTGSSVRLTSYVECNAGWTSFGDTLYVKVGSCASGTEYNPETGQCEAPEPLYCDRPDVISAIESARMDCEATGGDFTYLCSDEQQTWESSCDVDGGSCSDVEGQSGDVTWDSKVWGNSAPSGYLCSSKGGGCGASIDRSSSWCGESGWCYASFTVIGPECSVPDGPSFCSDPECKGFKDPDADPDDKPDTDPNHDPDDPTGDIEDPNKLPDTDVDLTDPDDVDPEPDVEDPEQDETTDTAVVEAIKNMNKDVNGALHAMNVDVNASQANIINELKTLNAEVRLNSETIQNQQKNDNDIYENTKALIQQANTDITTSVNKNTNAVNALKGSVDGIAEDVEGMLEGITNTDTSGAGIGGTCIQSGNCKGFYNSGYPDGLNGLVSEQLEKLKTNTIDNFVNSFGRMDLSNAKRPSFVLPVPFFGDFSFETYINFDWIFGFVRACLIMTSIFAARRIIFGG